MMYELVSPIIAVIPLAQENRRVLPCGWMHMPTWLRKRF